MFPARIFAPRYFNPRYWPKVGAAGAPAQGGYGIWSRWRKEQRLAGERVKEIEKQNEGVVVIAALMEWFDG